MTQRLPLYLGLSLCVAGAAHASPARAEQSRVLERLVEDGELSRGQAKVLVKAMSKRMKRAAATRNRTDRVRTAVARAIGQPASSPRSVLRVNYRLRAGFNEWALDHLFADKANPGPLCARGFKLSPNLCDALMAAAARPEDEEPTRTAWGPAATAIARADMHPDVDEAARTSTVSIARETEPEAEADEPLPPLRGHAPPAIVRRVPSARELAAEARAQAAAERRAALRRAREERAAERERQEQERIAALQHKREQAAARAQAKRDRIEAARQARRDAAEARAQAKRDAAEARAQAKRDRIEAARQARREAAEAKRERAEAIKRKKLELAAEKARREQERRDAIRAKQEAIAAEKARREQERRDAIRAKQEAIAAAKAQRELERQQALQRQREEAERRERERREAIERERNRIEVARRKAEYEQQRAAYLTRQHEQMAARRDRVVANVAGEKVQRGPTSRLEAELVGLSPDASNQAEGRKSKAAGPAAKPKQSGLDMVDDLVAEPTPKGGKQH